MRPKKSHHSTTHSLASQKKSRPQQKVKETAEAEAEATAVKEEEESMEHPSPLECTTLLSTTTVQL